MCRASCIHTGFGRIALLGLTYPEGIIWHAPILKPMHEVKIWCDICSGKNSVQ